jgi:hypothetical protein
MQRSCATSKDRCPAQIGCKPGSDEATVRNGAKPEATDLRHELPFSADSTRSSGVPQVSGTGPE